MALCMHWGGSVSSMFRFDAEAAALKGSVCPVNSRYCQWYNNGNDLGAEPLVRFIANPSQAPITAKLALQRLRYVQE